MLVQIVLSLSGSVCSSLVLIIQSSVHSIKQPSILGTAYLSTNLQTCLLLDRGLGGAKLYPSLASETTMRRSTLPS